jgi:carbohydrate diacid regulator
VIIVEISSTLAQVIVTDMKKIINQELNFMDTDGLVIASTDPNRINSYHEGAKKVISTKEDLIIEDTGQFKGTKKGINLPIYFENKLIGVIGITGEKDEVVKYGQIIKKMTEILIKEAWVKDYIIQLRENYRTIIDYLLFSPEHEEGHSSFSNMFDINLLSQKIVVVGNMNKTKNSPANVTERMNVLLDKYFPSKQQNIYTIKNEEIIMIIDHTFEKNLEYSLHNLIKESLENLSTPLLFGIGLTTSPAISHKKSYELAKTTVRWTNLFSNDGIYYFKDLDLGLILNSTPAYDKSIYIHKVLSNLSEAEIKEYSEIMDVYGSNNGSITKCADDLFIHKNTLQYKLNKLDKLTGYNPRNMNDYVILKLAFLLYKTV